MAHLKSVLTFPPASAEERALASLASQYVSVRQQTDALTAPLTPEDLMVQSCPEASPAKWHLAHTSWFFETFILSSHLPGYRPFHPQFRDLFNSYYNAVGQQPEKALRNTFSRPALEEIRKYRAHVDEHMLKLLQSGSVAAEAQKLVTLGLNHEQQHQELIVTDIKHGFWSNPLHPAYQAAVAAPSLIARRNRSRSFILKGCMRSARKASNFISTMKVRGTKFFSGRSALPCAWRRAANISLSWKTQVIHGLSFGSLTAGKPCRHIAGKRRSTGRKLAANGSSSPAPACAKWKKPSRSAT